MVADNPYNCGKETTMKKNHEYEINFVTNTITVTKQFREEASQIGTEAFKTMKDLLALNMSIVEREIKRKPAKVPKWSYAEMRKYLSQVEDSDKWLADFDALTKAVAHGVVWSWFKSNFNPVDKKGKRVTPKMNANHKIVVLPKADASKAKDIIENAKDSAPIEKRA